LSINERKMQLDFSFMGFGALEWAWNSAKTIWRCVRTPGRDGRTNGHSEIDSANDPDQEYYINTFRRIQYTLLYSRS